MSQYWQATALAGEVKVHYTTLNNWFNQMEDKRIHYVTRAPGGDRVFDGLDLHIALYIKSRRDEKWNLEAIYNTIPENIETRPFPEDFTKYNDNQLATLDQLKMMFSQEIKQLLDQEINEKLFEMQLAIDKMGESVQKSLPIALTPEQESKIRLEERDRRATDLITENRIMMTMKLEALDEWSKLPADSRLVKTGLFRKEEDTTKREKFILEYQKNHFEERLRNELKTDV